MFSIYQQILGNEFNLLGKNLQYGHSVSPVIQATGTIDVTWSKLFFIRWANKINGLPPEGKNQILELEVIRNEKLETWSRKFNPSVFTTSQFTKKGRLYEKDGAVTLTFELKVEEGNLAYHQTNMYVYGFPVPSIFAIKSKAMASEMENGWQVKVEVKAPIFGLILKYDAQVQINNKT